MEFAATIVTIVLDGVIVPSFAPARLAGGHVLAPLAPVVARFARSAALVPGGVTIERDGRRITLPVVVTADGSAYVEMARVVRGLGGRAAFDPRSKTLALTFPDERELATPPPFDPRAPQASPTALFTPEPPRPTPREVETGVPIPRRTAIPAVPSWPVVPTNPSR